MSLRTTPNDEYTSSKSRFASHIRSPDNDSMRIVSRGHDRSPGWADWLISLESARDDGPHVSFDKPEIASKLPRSTK